jgi:hypothetical protein
MTRQSLLAPGRFLPGTVQPTFVQVIDHHEILNSRRSAAWRTAQGTGQSAGRPGAGQERALGTAKNAPLAEMSGQRNLDFSS